MKLTLGQTPGRADPTPLNTPGVLSPETAAPPGHMVTQPVTTKTGAWTVLQKHPSPTPGTPSGTWGLLMHMMQTFPMVLQQAGILAVNTLLMTDQPGVTANPTVINFTCTLMLTVQSMADQAVMAGMPIGVRAQGGGRRGQGLTAMTGGLEAATVWKRHQAGWMHEPISQASPDRGVDGLRVIQMWPLLLTGGTAVSTPPQRTAETHPSAGGGAPEATEAQEAAESLVEGGAAAAAEAGAQTQAAGRGAKRVGSVGSQQLPPPRWLGTPPLLPLQ